MPNPICHFEFMVTNDARSQEFYGKIFDWKFEKDDQAGGYTMIRIGQEPEGGMMNKPDQAPHPALNVYFMVDDLDTTLEKIKSAGGTVIVGRQEIPYGWWAMFADPDGIPVGIFQSRK